MKLTVGKGRVEIRVPYTSRKSPLWMRILGFLGIGEFMVECTACGQTMDPENVENHEKWCDAQGYERPPAA